MLIISKRTPTTSRRCLNKDEAFAVTRALIDLSMSFYCEPEPNDMYLIFVNEDAWHIVDGIFNTFRAQTATPEE